MQHADRMEEFLKLFTKHELRLRAFAMSMVANFADAEDVVQQANLLMWKRFDQFQLGTEFMSWAGRIVYLVALQHRQKQMQNKLQFGEAFFGAMATVAAREEVAERLGVHEKALGECMTRLKPEQQQLLKARYTDGNSIEQLSQTFHRSVEAIYKVLSRTRRMLHNCICLKIRTEASHGR
jgi:RNA polymerase sigma-70 factor, ECF subfamily